MPRITYTCSKCDETITQPLDDATRELTCPACSHVVVVSSECLRDGEMVKCAVCPSGDLFVRKDFPQGLGLSIIIAGFAASTVTYYYQQIIATFAILFVTALIDAVLYLVMGNVLQCYRCEAQYRGLPGIDAGPEFDLTVHEKHRQQEARLEAEGKGARGNG